MDKENLKNIAADLNLDTQTFNECLDSGKHTALVQNDSQMARQLGVSSTPAFVINGQAILGAQPFSAFQQVLDQALNSPE